MTSRIAQVALNSALALPLVRKLRDRNANSTGANATADPEAVMLEWSDKIRSAVARVGESIINRDMVEVGPGHSFGVALCLLLDGAKSVAALDVAKRCDLDDHSAYISLRERWQQERHQRAPQALAETMARLQFSVIQDSGLWPFQSGTKDIVYSYFAGEHLRSPELTISETSRVLRENGLCLYAIDLRNHVDHEGNWLSHLYHSDFMWNAMYSRRGAWTNRKLAREWRALFERHFEILSFETRLLPPPDGFDRERLAGRFKSVPDAELLIDYVWVIGRKSQ